MKKKPNVLIIISDELRFDALSCMGSSVVKTPNIDALANDGVLFENAHCAGPLCVPSRVSLFTGQYSHRTRSVFFDQKDYLHPEQSSLLRTLKEDGYRTALVGKNDTFDEECFEQLIDTREEFNHFGKQAGQITESDQQVINYLGTENRPEFQKSNGWLKESVLGEGLIDGPMPFPPEQCPTARIAEDAIEFISKNKEQPFMLYCSFPGPHWPNVVCEPYYSMYPPEKLPDLEAVDIDWSDQPFKYFVQSQACGNDKYTDLERKRILATYYGQISFIDDKVGEIIDSLQKNGIAEDTIVLFLSDHGDFGGRYGLVGKTSGFQEVLLRIPLILRIPGMEGGKRRTANVSMIDITPTLLDFLGFEIPSDIQGLSFKEVLAGERVEHRTEIFAEVGRGTKPPLPIPLEQYADYNNKRTEQDGWCWFTEYTCAGRAIMIKKDGWKYVHHTYDKNELYNLINDPYEMQNLAANPKYVDIEEKLKNSLMNWCILEAVKHG